MVLHGKECILCILTIIHPTSSALASAVISMRNMATSSSNFRDSICILKQQGFQIGHSGTKEYNACMQMLKCAFPGYRKKTLQNHISSLRKFSMSWLKNRTCKLLYPSRLHPKRAPWYRATKLSRGSCHHAILNFFFPFKDSFKDVPIVTRRYLLLRIKANTPEGAND